MSKQGWQIRHEDEIFHENGNEEKSFILRPMSVNRQGVGRLKR